MVVFILAGLMGYTLLPSIEEAIFFLVIGHIIFLLVEGGHQLIDVFDQAFLVFAQEGDLAFGSFQVAAHSLHLIIEITIA